MSLKKACLIVKATNSRVGSLRLPTLAGWLLLNLMRKRDTMLALYPFSSTCLINKIHYAFIHNISISNVVTLKVFSRMKYTHDHTL